MSTTQHRSARSSIIAALCLVLFSSWAEGQQLGPTEILVGDMILDQTRLHAYDTPPDPLVAAGTARASVYFPQYWSGGRVPVAFDSGVSDAQQAMVWAACQRWAAVADIRCSPRSVSDTEYLRVITEGVSGCSAVVGLSSTSSMSLAPTCWTHDLIVHELGHVFGLLHEHQRLDRDEYVEVRFDNILPAFHSAFLIATTSAALTEYDFRSIMHYHANAFAINPAVPNLIPRPKFSQFALQMGLGVDGGPSAGDGESMRMLYGPPPGVLPPAPPNLEILGNITNPIVLSWVPGAGGAPTSYTVSAGTAPGSSDLGTFPMGLSTSVTATLPVSARVYIRVVAANPSGTATSNEVSFEIGNAAAPGVPTLTLVQGTANPVSLSWAPGPGPAPDSYTVIAGTTPGGSELGVLPMGLSTSLTAAAPTGVPLFVRVAVTRSGALVESNEVSFTVGLPQPPTLNPPQVNGNTVHLSWAATASSYVLLARLAPAGPLLASLPAAVASLAVHDVPAGTYYVSVVSVSGGTWSAESNQIVVTVP